MKFNWNYFKILILIVLSMGFYAFSDHKSSQKNATKINIDFVGNQNLYLTEETVNKLLIVNYGRVENMPKEKLDLNTIEKVIKANEMVKSAQVFLSVDGELTSRIIQRRPIGRVEGVVKFYLDNEGKRMPLSKNHSARVPLVTGKITDVSLEKVYTLLKRINEDDFFRKNVIGIHVKKNEKCLLKLRMENFVVQIGAVNNLEEKFRKFKAFYSKAKKDNALRKYIKVSLEYKNQVVCTKK
ncbi:MAG: hypothetical protein V3U92_10150 [Cellulophaga sp.]